MKRIRTLKLLLAGANLLLAAAVVLFAALFLFTRPRTDPGTDLPVPAWVPGPKTPPGELPALQNPMTKGGPDRSCESKPKLLLLGTLPNEARPGESAAFLRSAAGKDEFVAFVGERVGPWTLEEVHRDRAVFAAGSDRREVRLEEAPPARP